MAAAIWYVRKTNAEKPEATIINGVVGCFINDDDATPAATVRAAAATALGLPSGYFDSAVLALAAGGPDADGDVVTIQRDSKIAIA